MNIHLANQANKDAWNNFVFSSAAGSFLQTWEWGDVQIKLDQGVWRYVVEDDSGILAVALVIRRELPFGRCWLYMPYGPVIRDDLIKEEYMWRALREQLLELAEEEDATYIRMDPAVETTVIPRNAFLKLAKDWQKADREVQPCQTQLLDIRKGEKELLAGMHPKTRYNIRLAERKGVTVRFSSEVQDIEIFLRLSHEVAHRAQFRYHPDEYYRTIMKVLGPRGMSEIAIAEHEGQPLAAHLMMYTGPVATYAHGASSSAKRNLMAPLKLYWETIRRAQTKTCKTYDFFGVAPQDASDNHPWAGITRVKRGFGGKYVEYVGSHDLVLKPTEYQLLNMAKRIRKVLHV